MPRWYVIETQPNCEHKARVNLIDQDFEIFLPVYLRTSSHARRVRTVLAPYFPRYLFGSFDAYATRWGAIQNTRGVLRLLSDLDSKPLAVPEGYVEALQLRQARNGGTIKLTDAEVACRFRAGDQVRITDGPFTSFNGTVERLETDNKEGQRISVWVEIFGRKSKADFAETSLEAVA